MKNYLNLLSDVMRNGEKRQDRTGVGTLSVFGCTLQFNLLRGFPVVTTKKLYFNSVCAELAGFLRGVTSAAEMRELGTKIWDANANAPSWQESEYCRGPDDMGLIYGAKWRDFNGVDQLTNLIETIKNNPTDRRMVVSAWDPAEKRQCLPACHIFWQVYVRRQSFLDLSFYMRSCDVFLGLPFDIASYALLTHLIAKTVGLKAGQLKVYLGDTHIYLNHLEQVNEQLWRTPYRSPRLSLSNDCSVFSFKPEDASLINYKHYPAIEAEMAL